MHWSDIERKLQTKKITTSWKRCYFQIWAALVMAISSMINTIIHHTVCAFRH